VLPANWNGPTRAFGLWCSSNFARSPVSIRSDPLGPLWKRRGQWQFRERDPTSDRTAWRKTLKRAGVPYFRIYDLRSTYATRLSAGGVADEWVTQLLRQGDAKVFKKYSQMKLQMKREALEKMNRSANEMVPDSGTAVIQ
jgi:integrase